MNAIEIYKSIYTYNTSIQYLEIDCFVFKLSINCNNSSMNDFDKCKLMLPIQKYIGCLRRL